MKTYHPTLHFTPWSPDLFIRVPFQLHGEHTVLQPFRRIEVILHIVISVLPGTHFTWVKWSIWGLTALPKDTSCPKIERGETWYFSEIPAPSGIRNRTAGSDIGKAPRSNHCAMSLFKSYSARALGFTWNKIAEICFSGMIHGHIPRRMAKSPQKSPLWLF